MRNDVGQHPGVGPVKEIVRPIIARTQQPTALRPEFISQRISKRSDQRQLFFFVEIDAPVASSLESSHQPRFGLNPNQERLNDSDPEGIGFAAKLSDANHPAPSVPS